MYVQYYASSAFLPFQYAGLTSSVSRKINLLRSSISVKKKPPIYALPQVADRWTDFGETHQIPSDSPSELQTLTSSLPACSHPPLPPRRGPHSDALPLSAEREREREGPPPAVPGVSVTAATGEDACAE
jgi:hypothetical protein